jgi:hypothetical protein
MPSPPKTMRATTVRFPRDLWDALEEESASGGVSVAQFVREAAITRLAYMAGRRGDAEYERALRDATGAAASQRRRHIRSAA